MQFLVLQHEDSTHLGLFAPLIAAAGHGVTAVRLHRGDPLPALDGFDALWVLGGPMDVFDEDQYPWLAPEKALIRQAVRDRDMPAFGICLGHQLMAEALGGACARSGAEIGLLEVTHTAPSPFLAGLPDPFSVLLWHGVEVTALPPGATRIAASPVCAVQAIQYGARAVSFQSHPEVEPPTLHDWAILPGAGPLLDKAMGPGGAALLHDRVQAALPRLTANAETLFRNWCRATGIPHEG